VIVYWRILTCHPVSGPLGSLLAQVRKADQICFHCLALRIHMELPVAEQGEDAGGP